MLFAAADENYIKLFIAISLFSASFLEGNTLNTTISMAIDNYLTSVTAEGNFSGAILVAHEGAVIFKKAYGLASYELNVPNTVSTKFRIASMTKQFTAVSILQLQERGLLSEHDTVSRFIPDFPQGDGITIHQLLTHTSGIPEVTRFHDFETFKYFPHTVGQLVARVAQEPLDFVPGTRFSYSNSGYYLLTAIIEKASGMSYGEYVAKFIFNPLGMNNSGLDSTTTVIPQKAYGYSKDAGGLKKGGYLDMSLAVGSGGLYSTIEDLYRWDTALYTDQLINQSSRATMVHPFASLPELVRNFLGEMTGNPADTSYGYGVCISPDAKCISHAGKILGFSCVMLRFPQTKSSIIILSNNDCTPMKEICTQVAAYCKLLNLLVQKSK